MQLSFVNNTHVTQIRHDLVAPFASRRSLALLVTLAGLAGLVGPFGTFDAYPTVLRFLYWSAVASLTAAVGHASASGLERFLRQRQVPAPLELAAIALLAALPVSLVVALVSLAFGFNPFHHDLPVLYLQCAAVMGAIVTVFHLAEPPVSSAQQQNSGDTPVVLRRLPPAKRGRLMRLSAQDHYVEVVTDKGRELIALRFRDAIKETEPESGIQCHRSHWVALHTVTGRARQNGRAGLTLSGGDFIPIGRSFDPAVKAALSNPDGSTSARANRKRTSFSGTGTV
ncbi:LytTR family DNA-binding domain-containing protein [Roseibium sediminicola]|uniref:LytTR family transcriptional regulator DNA-binding domain-containing protein n=1 Tax=Roseibium sediminicola TaxID=2933272 RepID=A0ABT0H0S2_9HYPH|nr:LytTR family transcriptional regulator DNA-binding domain-containing protein [Roseibium sp. CAU 1639]